MSSELQVVMIKFKQESKEWKKEKGFLFYLEQTELQNVINPNPPAVTVIHTVGVCSVI